MNEGQILGKLIKASVLQQFDIENYSQSKCGASSPYVGHGTRDRNADHLVTLLENLHVHGEQPQAMASFTLHVEMGEIISIKKKVIHHFI